MSESHPDRRIVIVSGLPRSGTSMMMQMLAAGGCAVLADDHRPADESNPRGYLEYQPVKASLRDMSWIDHAPGKAVKVIHLLLPRLPDTYDYDIIFMLRDVAEVVASQHTMLQRLNQSGAELSDAQLAETYARQVEQCLEWANDQPHTRLLTVNYHDVINAAPREANRVATFLDQPLNREAMVAAVDPALYRTRL